MWKVYHIQTGKIVRAGFEKDDDAKEWMERRRDLADDDYDIDEMDEEEELEYEEAAVEEDDFEVGSEQMPEPLFAVEDEEERLSSAGGEYSEFDADDSGYNVVDDDDF